MATLTEKPGYKMMSIILSKRNPFQIEEIVEELKNEGIEEDFCVIKKALEQLKDKGILVKHGSSYIVYKRHF